MGNGYSMLEVIQLALVVTVGLSVATGAIIAAWRMIPHRASAEVPTARLEAVEDALDGLRLSLVDLGDKYEITIRRNATRVGKLRRKVSRLQGEDEDEDEDVEPAPALPLPTPPPCAAASLSKVELYARARAATANGGRA